MKESQLTARTTENIPQTKRIFKTVEDLLSEGIFQIEEDGVRLLAADPAMVALIDLKLEPGYFSEEYNVEEEEKAGVNLHGFYKAIRKANKGEELTIEYGNRDINQTTWGMESIVSSDLEESKGFNVEVHSDDGFWTKKSLPYLNLREDDVPTVGQLDWENKVEIKGDNVKKALNLFKSSADSVVIAVTEDGFYMEALTDQDSDQGTFESGFEQESVNFLEGPVESSTMLSMDYLEKLFGGRMEKMADKVTIHQASDSADNNAGGYPVKFSVEGEDFKFETIIAPRIEDE